METDMTAVTKLIEPKVKALGFDLVRVAMIGGSSAPTLQVMAERPDTRQLTIDDCSDISRKLSDLLDECDPIEGAYRLEVSSPGIDRPLTRLSDFADWAGHEAKVQFREPIEGRKALNGVLGGVEGDMIAIDDRKSGAVRFRLEDVAGAKLLLTDRLIAATRPLDTSGADEEELGEPEPDDTDAEYLSP